MFTEIKSPILLITGRTQIRQILLIPMVMHSPPTKAFEKRKFKPQINKVKSVIFKCTISEILSHNIVSENTLEEGKPTRTINLKGITKYEK